MQDLIEIRWSYGTHPLYLTRTNGFERKSTKTHLREGLLAGVYLVWMRMCLLNVPSGERSPPLVGIGLRSNPPPVPLRAEAFSAQQKILCFSTKPRERAPASFAESTG